jgi:hypothetical protein
MVEARLDEAKDQVDIDLANDLMQSDLDLPCKSCPFGPVECVYWEAGYDCWVTAHFAPRNFRVDDGWDAMYWSNWDWRHDQLKLPLEDK